MQEYGAIDYIGGLNDAEGRLYVLRKSTPGGDQLIVIQASAVVPEQNMEFDVADRLYPEWDREFDYGLEIIQTLLWQIDFSSTGWGQLVARSANHYRILSKKNPLPTITEIPWCPLVEERDIKITNWLGAEDRFGVWNGKEVDLFMGWDASYLKLLQQMMAAYKLLIERDLEHLAYRALGHVVRDGTNDICGIMTEATYGRRVEHKDKTAVYKAIAQIERAGLIYRGIKSDNIMVTDEGKVHLLYISALARQPSGDAERAEELEYWHWKPLEVLFQQLALGPNLLPPMRKLKYLTHNLPHFPVPARGLALNVYMVMIDHPTEERAEGENTRAVQRHSIHARAEGGSGEVLVIDAPMNARFLRPRQRLLVRATAPYWKPDKLVQELLGAQNWPAPNRAKISQ